MTNGQVIFSTRFECSFVIFSTRFECSFVIFSTRFECSFLIFSTRFECSFVVFSTRFECSFVVFSTRFECSSTNWFINSLIDSIRIPFILTLITLETGGEDVKITLETSRENV
jgi:hypothetical protein